MKNSPLVSDDDIALFLLMHKAIRRGLATLATTAPTPARGEWFSFMARSIHHHHSEESDLYPLLLRKDPSFADDLARLEADHAQLDPYIARITEGFASLPRSAEALHDDLVAFEALMREHLDREEAAVVPRMLRTVTVAELKGFEKEGGKTASFADLAMVIPWVLDAANEREREMVNEVLPWPARLLYRVSWKSRYARLAGEVAA
ncbi:MAG: hemerythrin domain-containing protein [Polyangiales bacterium]